MPLTGDNSSKSIHSTTLKNTQLEQDRLNTGDKVQSNYIIKTLRGL